MQNYQENTFDGVSLIKLQFINREALTQVLSCKFWKNFKNANFEEHLQTAAFVTIIKFGMSAAVPHEITHLFISNSFLTFEKVYRKCLSWLILWHLNEKRWECTIYLFSDVFRSLLNVYDGVSFWQYQTLNGITIFVKILFIDFWRSYPIYEGFFVSVSPIAFS